MFLPISHFSLFSVISVLQFSPQDTSVVITDVSEGVEVAASMLLLMEVELVDLELLSDF